MDVWMGRWLDGRQADRKEGKQKGAAGRKERAAKRKKGQQAGKGRCRKKGRKKEKRGRHEGRKGKGAEGACG
jgi:hypothetical protein